MSPQPERARDRLGRPLPADADPATVAPPVPTGLPDGPAALAAAEAALAAGLPFHAHEIFEERWRRTTGPEREAWRALAQFTAGLTHSARGNEIGAAALCGRGLRTIESLEPWPAAMPIDRDQTLAWCRLHQVA